MNMITIVERLKHLTFKRLDLKDHNNETVYGIRPFRMTDNRFVSFYIYEDEGLIPHFHIYIWKGKCDRRDEVKNSIIHVAFEIKRSKYYHEKELGVLENNEDLFEIINLLSSKMGDMYESVWDFILDVWNHTSGNNLVSYKNKIPDYQTIRSY